MDKTTLLINMAARLVLGLVYFTALIVTAAPSWAFVLALIAATYWGPPTRLERHTQAARNAETLEAILRTVRR